MMGCKGRSFSQIEVERIALFLSNGLQPFFENRHIIIDKDE
jgi:hypothetical protein